MHRRRFLGLVCDAAAVMAAPALMAAAARPDSVIAVTVRKFEFVPHEINVIRGREVTLAFNSIDFVHGFNLPDFAIRADLVPGRTTEVTLRPTKPGRYLFTCDNFCGEGHDHMAGVLVVNEA